MSDLAIIILNYNGSVDTIECIESIDKCVTEFDYNIFILDNNSIENQKNIIKEYIHSKSDWDICTYDTFVEQKNNKDIPQNIGGGAIDFIE